MFSLLHEYLIENERLFLPSLGTLQFVEVPARLDVVTNTFAPPQKIIKLQEGSDNGNNQTLIAFISRKLLIGEEQAYTVLQQFASSILLGLSARRILYWDNLGAFIKSEMGDVQFVQSTDLATYLPTVNANRIIRQHAQHPITVGDAHTTNIAMQAYYNEAAATADNHKKNNWWLWAILIFVGSLLLIWYKYYY